MLWSVINGRPSRSSDGFSWVSGDEPIAVERGWKVVIESPIVLSTKQHENRNDIDN